MTDRLEFVTIGHSDLNGSGDGMQVMPHQGALYVGHLGTSGMGTTIIDAADPTSLRIADQWSAPPGAHTHKVQVADDLLLVNVEAFRGGSPSEVGLRVYEITDPLRPSLIGRWDSTGKGVHRIVWEGGRYAYVSATPEGFDDRIWVVVDMSDPERPTEAGRWWWPGMARGEIRDWPAEEWRSVHHAMVRDNRAYVGFWDSGMVILDISDLSDISVVSHLRWPVGGHTHTCLPLNGGLVAVTDEALTEGCIDDPHMIRLVSIADETQPEVVSTLPIPQGDFCERGGRFGSHCLHENRPGSYQSDQIIFATYFNAGLRLYDVSVPDRPEEIAHWIAPPSAISPVPMANDVWVGEDLLTYVTDRAGGGVHAIRPNEPLTERLVRAQRISGS